MTVSPIFSLILPFHVGVTSVVLPLLTIENASQEALQCCGLEATSPHYTWRIRGGFNTRRETGCIFGLIVEMMMEEEDVSLHRVIGVAWALGHWSPGQRNHAISDMTRDLDYYLGSP